VIETCFALASRWTITVEEDQKIAAFGSSYRARVVHTIKVGAAEGCDLCFSAGKKMPLIESGIFVQQ
jgi:hypothetical protein